MGKPNLDWTYIPNARKQGGRFVFEAIDSYEVEALADAILHVEKVLLLASAVGFCRCKPSSSGFGILASRHIT